MTPYGVTQCTGRMLLICYLMWSVRLMPAVHFRETSLLWFEVQAIKFSNWVQRRQAWECIYMGVCPFGLRIGPMFTLLSPSPPRWCASEVTWEDQQRGVNGTVTDDGTQDEHLEPSEPGWSGCVEACPLGASSYCPGLPSPVCWAPPLSSPLLSLPGWHGGLWWVGSRGQGLPWGTWALQRKRVIFV